MAAKEIINNCLVFTFPHHINTIYCQENEATILESTGKEVLPVEFDMHDVDYICSSFLRICIQILKQRGKESYRLTHCTPGIKKVFKIAGYDRLMRIE